MKRKPTINQDYVKVTTPIDEDPYDTIPYLLRGKKTIKLPVRSFRSI